MENVRKKPEDFLPIKKKFVRAFHAFNLILFAFFSNVNLNLYFNQININLKHKLKLKKMPL